MSNYLQSATSFVTSVFNGCKPLFVCVPLALLAACAAPPSAPAPETTSTAPTVAAPAAPAPAPPAPAPATPPTPDKITALQAWVDQQNRLYRIAAPLMLNNTELCRRHARNLLGLTAKTRYSYTEEYADAARAALGLGERLRVMNVLPGSGAERAGVKKGDVLLAVDNKPLPQGPNAERDSAPIVSAAMQGRGSVNLTVLRDGRRTAITVPLTRACAFGIELSNASFVNSYADGHRALITRGMLNFVQTDDELAYVLAKELAHNVLMRSPRADMGAVIDRLRGFGVAPARLPADNPLPPYSPVMDATADKLSLYMLARANYDIDNALRFWRRLASQTPAHMRDGHTALHPSTNYRFSVMTQITQAIEAKRKRKLPLVP
jgi:hypothetical protein